MCIYENSKMFLKHRKLIFIVLLKNVLVNHYLKNDFQDCMYDYFSTWNLNNSDEYRYIKIQLISGRRGHYGRIKRILGF